MKASTTSKCVFCGSPATDSKHNEVLEIRRTCKRPRKSDKFEKTSITLPTCPSCYKKHHPFFKVESKLPLYAGLIAVACVLFSLIQKDFFSQSGFLGAVVALVFTGGAAFFFTWMGYLFTTIFFDDAFKASVKVKPYSDLEAVKYIKSNGYADADDEEQSIVNTDDPEYVPIETIREVLQNKYGCYRT